MKFCILEFLNFWIFEFLNFLYFEFFNSWIFEFLNFWFFDFLNFWIFEFLNFWTLNFWIFEFFNFGILTFFKVVIGSYCLNPSFRQPVVGMYAGWWYILPFSAFDYHSYLYFQDYLSIPLPSGPLSVRKTFIH